MIVKVQYKCRRCEQTVDTGSIPESWGTNVIVDVILQGKWMHQTGQITLHDAHSCADGGTGLCDFIGLTKPVEP